MPFVWCARKISGQSIHVSFASSLIWAFGKAEYDFLSPAHHSCQYLWFESVIPQAQNLQIYHSLLSNQMYSFYPSFRQCQIWKQIFFPRHPNSACSREINLSNLSLIFSSYFHCHNPRWWGLKAEFWALTSLHSCSSVCNTQSLSPRTSCRRLTLCSRLVYLTQLAGAGFACTRCTRNRREWKLRKSSRVRFPRKTFLSPGLWALGHRWSRKLGSRLAIRYYLVDCTIDHSGLIISLMEAKELRHDQANRQLWNK